MDATFVARLQYLGLCLLIIVSLSACQTTRTGSLCTAGPIIFDTGANDRLTRFEREQIVAFNNSGSEICKWNTP